MLQHFRHMVQIHRQAPLANRRRLRVPNRAVAEVALCDRQHWQAAFFAFVARSVLDSISAEKQSEVVHRELCYFLGTFVNDAAQ